MRQQRAHAGVDGFTLLEALLSIALMGLVLAALATITAQWMPSWNRGIASVQRQEAFALGIDRLVRDLSAAEYVSFAGDNTAPVFRGTEHSVIFVRRAAGPNFPLSLELVRLSEVDARDGPAMVRTRAPFAPAGLDATSPNFENPVALIRAPLRILFAYSDESGRWYPQWDQSPRLPRAVKITVADIATGRPLSTSTVAVVHAQAPPNCVYTNTPVCLTGAPKTEEGTQQDPNRQSNQGRRS